MIVSFAWTTEAFLDGTKTVTRRFWDANYARRFKLGMAVDAYDRSPRAHGKKVGQLVITRAPYLQELRDMPDDHFEREGGTRYWRNKAEFIEAMGRQRIQADRYFRKYRNLEEKERKEMNQGMNVETRVIISHEKLKELCKNGRLITLIASPESLDWIMVHGLILKLIAEVEWLRAQNAELKKRLALEE